MMKPSIGTSAFSLAVLMLLSSMLYVGTAAETEAQTGPVLPQEADQKSVSVMLGTGDDGLDMLVKHVISPSDEPAILKLIDVGVLKGGIIITNDGVKHHQPISNAKVLTIPPSDSDIKVEYELEDSIRMVDGFSTLELLYLQTIVFYPPGGTDLIFIDDRPLYLGDKDGFACHGCQMILEYAADVPSMTESFQAHDGRTFQAEILTRAEIDSFAFDQSAGVMSFQVSGERQFIVVITPAVIAEPYTVSLDGNKIFFQAHSNNETHVWFSMRPETGGTVKIGGPASLVGMVPPTMADEPATSDAMITVTVAGIATAAAVIAILLTRRRAFC